LRKYDLSPIRIHEDSRLAALFPRILVDPYKHECSLTRAAELGCACNRQKNCVFRYRSNGDT